MSNFPGSIDNDASLYVAKDYISTTLLAAQAIGDSVAVVTSGTGWAVNMVLSADVGKANVEQQLVTGVAGNVLTVTRGFGGTSASAHVKGAAVSNNVDAVYQSAAKAAIIAIETALGPNLRNIPALPILSAAQYNFAAQTPGGSLAAGANTITFPNGIPAGIAADSVGNAQLYISGGTGAAEAVPVAGVNVGLNQVTVTCDHIHSGAWTIQSATGGWQEAVIATGGKGRVMGGGVVDLFAPLVVPGTYAVSLRGLGKGSTQFLTHGLAGDWIVIKAGSGYADVGDFSITEASAAFHTSESMIRINSASYGTVSNIEIEFGYFGLTLNGCVGGVAVFNIIGGVRHYGLYLSTFGNVSGQTAVDVTNCRFTLVGDGNGGACFQIEGWSTTGVTLTSCGGIAIGDLTNTRVLQIVNANNNGGSEINVIGGVYDAAAVGILLTGDGVHANVNWISFTGVETNGSEYGLFIDAKFGNVKWTGGYIKAGGGTTNQPLFLRNTQNVRICDVDMDGLGTNAIIADAVTDVVLDGIRLGRNGNLTTNGLTFSNTITRFALQNSDFGAVATAANRITNPAQAGAELRLSNNIGLGDTKGVNYIATESGANNALVVVLSGVPLVAGLQMRILTAHTLQIGANTISVNGTVLNLKSSRNAANDIAVGYASGATIGVIYDGTVLQDVSQ